MILQSHLGLISRENHNSKRCTPVFTAALFTVAKTWKQPNCPLTEDWIKRMWVCVWGGGVWILLNHNKEYIPKTDIM